jgi:CcmD family protein
MHRSLFLFGFLLLVNLAQANSVEDALNSNGKIYVVVAILSIIFIGLAVYLFYLDRKVKKLEDHEN